MHSAPTKLDCHSQPKTPLTSSCTTCGGDGAADLCGRRGGWIMKLLLQKGKLRICTGNPTEDSPTVQFHSAVGGTSKMWFLHKQIILSGGC